MDSKKLLKTFIAGALSLTALVGCSGGNSSDTVKIGLNFELTGAVAEYGNAELRGAELAIKLANESGKNKFTYEAVSYDNKSDAQEATTLAAKLVSDGVVGVVGPATSGASKATYPTSNDSKVIVISPSATQNQQTLDTNGNVYEYVYRICFEDSYQGSAMAQYAYDELNARTAAIYGSVSSDYAKGLNDAFTAQFTKLGGKIVASESYQDGDTDFSSVLTTLASKDFDVLYIPGYYNEAGLIIKQARGLNIDCPIIGADGFDSPTLPDLAGASNLNDVYYTTAYTTVGASDSLQAFVDAYKKEYDSEPSMFEALAFDSMNLLIQAIEKAGTTDADAVNKAVAEISFSGVTGDFTFDETHTPIKSVLVVELVDGKQTTAVGVTPR
ncbi:MAG: ABC transporter substrate-binding protein [Traorella sp.]